ncbi:MAG: hypothetical protein C4548_03525 [Desulfobacteraceae bacterium]|jgi:hypothetical protein|nr:MAG: hypothetical protein C4548_03525 [Desulfobacteraceae bacterium]
MKRLSFNILALCILLPPILYLFSVNLLEQRMTSRCQLQIQNIYLADITDILNGLTRLRDSVREAIDNYLNAHWFILAGGRLDVSVTTRNGAIIYPATYQDDPLNGLPIDPVRLAEENFKTLNDGLDIHVEAVIEPWSFMAIGILLFYLLIFMGWLWIHYRRVAAFARQEELQRQAEIERLQEFKGQGQSRIEALSQERESLLTDYQILQNEIETKKRQAEETEEDLFDEIAAMEEKLAVNLALQEQQHDEIDKLKEQIRELAKTRDAADRQREKEADRLGKRFKVLYKNLEITERALENLADMADDMSLKAEEVMSLLNTDPSLVPVKRKVFSKKGKSNALEITFAYNGRLYFRRNSDGRAEVLTVGTKNTQTRDLAYLDSLR